MSDPSQPVPTPRVLSMTQLMTPDMVNFSGKIHGGALLKILDEVAFTCAARYTGRYVVTLLVDDVRFRAPVHVGELVTFLASVNWVGRTSLEVGIRVVAENYRTGSSRHVISCFFVMVAMDDDGRPREVTKFTPSNEVEQRRWADAERRQEVLRASRAARPDDGE
ncbi:MAG: acyl-CoA thioesterase [Sandaracinaceae bacterium]|nr:acyl-CoA thioesterase [Sandaracinaceae bacterium]MBK7152089.1 acyl-CoA thioesterase [Sandaracinaceae bacterium]MBK8410974.1 acyl-CoA thioesterase [Sandaracinaceae bacterium]MBK8587789.1 acyl-CoA thioesterase [Sandaracinaceae bacterium]